MTIRNILVAIAAGLLVVLIGAWTAVGYMTTKDIETPQYEVEREAKGYEIRVYAPRIQAEVTIEGGYRESLYGGFRALADYIFGNNTAREDIAMTAPVLSEKAQKIAMTAPVLHEKQGETDAFSIAFVMPATYTLETLPKPNNPEVIIRQLPERRYAVSTFRGYATERGAKKRIARLLAALERDNLPPAGEAVVAQYNPPWTPPYMRHNEIHIPLD